MLSWKYYPNPTQGILTVELEENIGEIYLSDISGKVLEQYQATKNKSFQIDLSPYSNGIYFLRYEYEPDKWLNGKVILDR
ncbi:MAG: T9SS type A sorting domain-containing protein [Bacteroidia bacterium]|nr:T9SS type A sorting domain-containing protein [Bacteroidia bacterium]